MKKYKIIGNLKFWHICFKSLFLQKENDTDTIKGLV